MTLMEVKRLGGPVGKGSSCHWNGLHCFLPIRVEDLMAICVDAWNFHVLVLPRSRSVDRHILSRQCIGSPLDVSSCVVENEDVIVVRIVLGEDVHGLGDLGNYIVMHEITVTTLCRPECCLALEQEETTPTTTSGPLWTTLSWFPSILDAVLPFSTLYCPFLPFLGCWYHVLGSCITGITS